MIKQNGTNEQTKRCDHETAINCIHVLRCRDQMALLRKILFYYFATFLFALFCFFFGNYFLVEIRTRIVYIFTLSNFVFFSFNFHVNFTLTRTKPIHSISLLQNLHCCPFSNLEKREKEKSREEKKKMNGIELVFINFQFFVSFSAFQLQLQLQHQNK